MTVDTAKMTDALAGRVAAARVATNNISKTTLFGYLFLLLAAAKSIHFNDAGHLAMTPRDWFQAAVGLAGAVLGHMMQDAGKQESIMVDDAGKPTGEVKVVDSHETPNDPGAVPVVNA